MPHPADPRPDYSAALQALLVDLCKRVPAFSRLDARRFLLVAGEARETSRATVRPLQAPEMPRVLVDGQVRHFEITLRPLFFLSANGLGRLGTLCHELLHVDPDGRPLLAPERRHQGNHSLLDREVDLLARAYVEQAPSHLLAPLGHHGEVLMRQWRVRPGPGMAARQVGNAQLFHGVVRVVTPVKDRTVWWAG